MNKLQKLAAAGLTDSPEDLAKFYDMFPNPEDFDMWYESQNQYAMGGIKYNNGGIGGPGDPPVVLNPSLVGTIIPTTPIGVKGSTPYDAPRIDMNNTGVLSWDATEPPVEQPRQLAWQPKRWTREELAEMHKGKKYGKNIFEKIAAKIRGRGSDRGGIIHSIKGACGPHGCLKPGMEMGGITNQIAFPQQPLASFARGGIPTDYQFFAGNQMPYNGPIGFYADGGFTGATPDCPNPPCWPAYDNDVQNRFNTGQISRDEANLAYSGNNQIPFLPPNQMLQGPDPRDGNMPMSQPGSSMIGNMDFFKGKLAKSGPPKQTKTYHRKRPNYGGNWFTNLFSSRGRSGGRSCGPAGCPKWEEGGETDQIAYPQQPTEYINFSAFPWTPEYNMGGGLPGGANEGMPCMECGGYMEMGGDNMFGGQADGTMVNFKEGGNWIQKATKNMRTDKPCTGDKFGGPSCPPGSKRYNLAKTFRKMAKKQDGGSIFDAKQDYLDKKSNDFLQSVQMLNNVNLIAEAAADRQSMSQDAQAYDMPMGQYGYNMGYNNMNQPVDMQNLYNERMLGQQLSNLQSKNKNLFRGLGSFINASYNDPGGYVKHSWTRDMSYPQQENNVNNSANYNKVVKFGGMNQDGLVRAQFGNAGATNPFTSANNIPGGLPGNIQGPVSYPSDAPYPGESDRDYAYRSYLNQAGRQVYGDNYNRSGIRDNSFRNTGWNNPLSRSGNNQSMYDYGTPGAYNNLWNKGGRYNWNTPGWGGINPFTKEMFENQYYTTRLASIDPEYDTVRTGFLGLGKKKVVPKKISIKYNTYLNPQTGQVETKPKVVAEDQNKTGTNTYKNPMFSDDPEVGLGHKINKMQSMDTPDVDLPAFERLPVTGTSRNQGPSEYENFMDFMNQQQLPGPREQYENDPIISDRQRQIEALINNRFVDPYSSGSNINYNMPITPVNPNVPVSNNQQNDQGFWDYMMSQQRPGPRENNQDDEGFMDFMMNQGSPYATGPREYRKGGLIKAVDGMQPPGSQFFNINMDPFNMANPANPANPADPFNPAGSYTHTQEWVSDPWKKRAFEFRALGAAGQLMGNKAEENRIANQMQNMTIGDNRFDNRYVKSNRGIEGQSGQSLGMQMGNYTPVEQTGIGITKYGGSPNYEVGDIVELSDEEIDNIRKAGGEIEYI